jgi:diaminopimelate decarboxylase
VDFIARLGNTLSEMVPEKRSMIEFVDIGGGFWPGQGEWLQSDGTSKSSSDTIIPLSMHGICHYKRPSTTIRDFADQIAQAVRTHLFPYVSCRICAEPGRWLCNDAMHLLLTVVDKKAKDLWGYAYWGKDIQPGDVLLIPTQGAYTYSLRQDFIKPLPAVVMLDRIQ